MLGFPETVTAKDAAYLDGVKGPPGVLWVGGVVWYYVCNIFQVHLDDVWWRDGVNFLWSYRGGRAWVFGWRLSQDEDIKSVKGQSILCDLALDRRGSA